MEEKSKKHYSETFQKYPMRYEDLHRFINSLNNEERKVVGYYSQNKDGMLKIEVFFARIGEQN